MRFFIRALRACQAVEPSRIAQQSREPLQAPVAALDDPVAAITAGQSLVVYDGSRVLGGGIIEGSRRSRAPLPILAA